jgi:hypothetical protein
VPGQQQYNKDSSTAAVVLQAVQPTAVTQQDTSFPWRQQDFFPSNDEDVEADNQAETQCSMCEHCF